VQNIERVHQNFSVCGGGSVGSPMARKIYQGLGGAMQGGEPAEAYFERCRVMPAEAYFGGYARLVFPGD
jgi:hypothetical protein